MLLQQYAMLSTVTPQEPPPPALTIANPSPPGMSTGTGSAVSYPLFPQQYAAPPVVTPQVWLSSEPPASITENASPPVTATGTERETVEPSPSWPKSFAPQQYADPPV